MTHSLTLGALLLTDDMPEADHGYVFSVLAEGASFGVAQGVQEVVRSLLADGDLVRTTRYGNRQVTFRVQITGPSLGALAQGEAALRSEVGRGNLLTWQAPDLFAAATVFEVIDSEMSQSFADLDELRNRRTFELTLTCSPFARSEDPVTVPALMPPPPGTPVTVTVDNADSVAPWVVQVNRRTGLGSAAVVDVGDGVSFTTAGLYARLALDLTASPADTTTTPYVMVEMVSSAVPTFVAYNTSGTALYPVIAMTKALPNGNVLYALRLDGHLIASIGITILSADGGASESAIAASVYDVSRTNVLPVVTTRQATRNIDTGGTERTPASIQVAPRDSGGSLGLAIAHTCRDTRSGYSPALRQYRVSGNTVTADSTLVSGAREAVGTTPVVAQVPIVALPEGEYAVVALMRSTVAGTFPIAWQARTAVDGEFLGGNYALSSATFAAANTWTIVPLDVATLPPVRAGAPAYVQIQTNRVPVGAEVIEMDEWWTFSIGEDSALTIVNSLARYMWLDSPDSTSAVPRVWVGNSPDRGAAYHPGPGLLAQGNHVLHPEGTAVTVVTSLLQSPVVSATYHRRWHSNAAE